MRGVTSKGKSSSNVYLACGLTAVVLLAGASLCTAESSIEFIVQGPVGETLELSPIVESVGGVVTGELGIIGAVTARLTRDQLDSLRSRHPALRIFADQPVSISLTEHEERDDDDWDEEECKVRPDHGRSVAAGRLHREGVTGWGVTVAVVDTGYWPFPALATKTDGQPRVLAQYDAIRDRQILSTWLATALPTDQNGHGTHVTSIVASRRRYCDGQFGGIAPDADLVAVRALDETGAGRYIDVIRGIDWVVTNKRALGIRVLNLAFSAKPRTHYWDDPLNQAVMKAWGAGIVVVVAAGNGGPEAMSIGVPGNNPYAITVGAMSDNATPRDRSDDFVTRFSGAGPTIEGFVKPEIVAPGAHVLGLMQQRSYLALTYPRFAVGGNHYRISGTSQATAVVSGVAALILSREPWLSPAQVKSRLMGTARAASTSSGELAFSIFQQGAGLVHAYDASHSEVSDIANRGLDVDKDLLGIEHYGGRANQDSEGNYYLVGIPEDGLIWNGAFLWRDAYLWRDAFVWGDDLLWSEAFLWRDAYLWRDAFVLDDAFAWTRLFRQSVYIQIEP